MDYSFEKINEIIANIDSSPNWKLWGEVAFQGTDEKYVEIDISNLDKILSFNQDSIFNKSKIVGSRHGSLLSVTDKSRWTLDLISRSHEILYDKKMSPPKVIEAFINFFTNPMFSENAYGTKDMDMSFTEKHLIYPIRQLTLYFHCYKEYDVQDEGEIIDKYRKNQMAEIFIPEITFHPISLVRNMFLCKIDKSLIDFENPLVRMEMELVKDIYGNHIDFENINNSDIAEIKIDFHATIAESLKKLKEAEMMTGGIASLLKEPSIDDAQIKGRDFRKKEGGWGSPSDRIALSRARQFKYRNGLLYQLTEENIKEIIDHLTLLAELAKKGGKLKRYSKERLD